MSGIAGHVDVQIGVRIMTEMDLDDEALYWGIIDLMREARRRGPRTVKSGAVPVNTPAGREYLRAYEAGENPEWPFPDPKAVPGPGEDENGWSKSA